MDPRYLATWLGVSDQPPSAFLPDLDSMGMRGRGSVDEFAILGDFGECLGFIFGFVGVFNVEILTGSGEGVNRSSVIAAVSEVTDGEQFLGVDRGVGVRIDSCTTVREDIISMGGASETVDEILVPVFSFYSLRIRVTEETRVNSIRTESEVISWRCPNFRLLGAYINLSKLNNHSNTLGTYRLILVLNHIHIFEIYFREKRFLRWVGWRNSWFARAAVSSLFRISRCSSGL